MVRHVCVVRGYCVFIEAGRDSITLTPSTQAPIGFSQRLLVPPIELWLKRYASQHPGLDVRLTTGRTGNVFIEMHPQREPGDVVTQIAAVLTSSESVRAA